MLKALGRAARTFVRALDTASAIRHGAAPKRYDDVVVPMSTAVEKPATSQPEAA